MDALVKAIDPKDNDVIVALGDCVNRGPDSEGVLDRLIALEEECKLIPLLGNHDEMLVQLLIDARIQPHSLAIWLRMGGDATLASYGARPGKISWADLARIPPKHAAFLERRRPERETARHVFVPSNFDRRCRSISSHLSCCAGNRCVTSFNAHCSGKIVIAGHSSQKTGEILDLGYLVCIDTYCYGGGWLTAFDVDTREIWQTNSHGEVASQ